VCFVVSGHPPLEVVVAKFALHSVMLDEPVRPYGRLQQKKASAPNVMHLPIYE
jgi:hypothetical protein